MVHPVAPKGGLRAGKECAKSTKRSHCQGLFDLQRIDLTTSFSLSAGSFTKYLSLAPERPSKRLSSRRQRTSGSSSCSSKRLIDKERAGQRARSESTNQNFFSVRNSPKYPDVQPPQRTHSRHVPPPPAATRIECLVVAAYRVSHHCLPRCT